MKFNQTIAFVLILALVDLSLYGQSSNTRSNSFSDFVFFKASKDRRVSLSAIEAQARKFLHEKYAGFPQTISLGSLHVQCKGSKESFDFFYALGTRDEDNWEIILDADFKVHYIASKADKVDAAPHKRVGPWY